MVICRGLITLCTQGVDRIHILSRNPSQQSFICQVDSGNSSNHNRIFFDVSLYHLHFSRALPLRILYLNSNVENFVVFLGLKGFNRNKKITQLKIIRFFKSNSYLIRKSFKRYRVVSRVLTSLNYAYSPFNIQVNLRSQLKPSETVFRLMDCALNLNFFLLYSDHLPNLYFILNYSYSNITLVCPFVSTEQ